MRELTLEDVCSKITDGAHFSPKNCPDGKYPMFSVKDMQEYGFSYKNCKYVSDEDYEKLLNSGCVPEVGDVLVAKDGSYLKHIFVVKEKKEEAILSSIAIFRPNELILPEYLLYILKNPAMKKMISDNYVSGSALPRIVLKDFKKIKLRVPEIDTQRKVINILGNIDKKIDLNNKLNANLEEVVSAKFQEIYSVDTDLKGSMSDIVKFSNGKKKPDGSGEVPIYGGNGILAYTNDSNYEDIIIVGRVGAYCGSLYYEPGLCWVSDNAIAAKSRTNCNYYIYELLKTYNLNNMHIGSSQPLLTQGILNSIEIKLLDEEIISSFNNWAKSFYALVSLNKKENQKLEHLREVLLPRLMSGEIDLFEKE